MNNENGKQHMTQQNPYQAPVKSETDHVPDGSFELATRSQRFFAALIDFIFGLIIAVPFWMATGMTEKMMKGIQPGILEIITGTVYGFVMYLLIHGYYLNKHGQTIGKRLLGIYIADAVSCEKSDFNNIVLMRVLPISVVSAIPYLGSLIVFVDTIMIFRSDRRCGHDLIAKTVVLKTSE